MAGDMERQQGGGTGAVKITEQITKLELTRAERPK
jgi:hypothetical protein